MSLFSTIKIFMILGSIATIAGGGYYITGLKDALERSKINSAQMKDAITSKEVEITRLKENIGTLRKITENVETVRSELEQEVDILRMTLGKHDLGYLAYKKPGLIERRVNSSIERDIKGRIERIVANGIDDEDS